MKNKPYWGMIAFAVIVIYLWLTSCNPYGFAIWPEDDPAWSPTDTIPVVDTLPLTTDTCPQYFPNPLPKFCTWAINLDSPPSEYKFFLQTSGHYKQINLDSFLNQFGQSVTYYSGANIAGIITGWDNPSWGVQHSIFTKDGFGTLYLLTFNPYNFVFNGTLTFAQFDDEFESHASFKRLGFWNTAFQCDQYNMILDYIIDSCIDGTGKTLDLRKIPVTCPVDQERIDRLKAAHFTIWI